MPLLFETDRIGIHSPVEGVFFASLTARCLIALPEAI